MFSSRTAWPISIAVFLTACASTEPYPSHWHDRDGITVVADDGAHTLDLTAGEDTTILDLILSLDRTPAPMRVVLRRGAADADPLEVVIDVRDMIRTGDTTYNVVLLPGDVVELTS